MSVTREKRILCLVITLLLAMEGCRDVTPAQNPAMTMEQQLNAFLEGEIAPEAFQLSYQVGDDFSGATALECFGNGNYHLESSVTTERQLAHFDGQVAANEIVSIAQAMVDHKIWNVRHGRPLPGDGEAVPTITIMVDGKATKVDCWGGEVVSTPQFAAVQDLILGLIKRISGGQILEVGR